MNEQITFSDIYIGERQENGINLMNRYIYITKQKSRQL